LKGQQKGTLPLQFKAFEDRLGETKPSSGKDRSDGELKLRKGFNEEGRSG